MEIIQQVDKAQLEETCVLMNGDELDASREGKNKPYKVTSPLHLLNHLHSCSLSP
jgi:CO dehydrogenase/acetyl-CoA synthase beta subunit